MLKCLQSFLVGPLIKAFLLVRTFSMYALLSSSFIIAYLVFGITRKIAGESGMKLKHRHANQHANETRHERRSPYMSTAEHRRTPHNPAEPRRAPQSTAEHRRAPQDTARHRAMHSKMASLRRYACTEKHSSVAKLSMAWLLDEYPTQSWTSSQHSPRRGSIGNTWG